jgi:hypothetical protein
MLLNIEGATLGVEPRHAVYIGGVSYVGGRALRRYTLISFQIDHASLCSNFSGFFVASLGQSPGIGQTRSWSPVIRCR